IGARPSRAFVSCWTKRSAGSGGRSPFRPESEALADPPLVVMSRRTPSLSPPPGGSMNVSGRWLVSVAFLLTSCLGREGPEPEADEEELSSGSCGVERWSVKTGSDSAVGQVNMTAQDTTIVALRGMAVPSGLGQNSA